jgi:hypothetical protein
VAVEDPTDDQLATLEAADIPVHVPEPDGPGS